MTIICKHCATKIKPENINPETQFATCPQCGAVVAPPGAELRDPVPAQRTIQLEQLGEEVIFTRRWSDENLWQHVATWAGCHLFFGLAYNQARLTGNGGVWALILLGVLSVGLTYWLLSRLINKTVVRANPLQVAITTGPLPTFTAPRRVAASEIKQLYARKREHHGPRNAKYITYDVWLQFADTRPDEVLVKELATVAEALYLEQQMELALRLRDVPVANELPR